MFQTSYILSGTGTRDPWDSAASDYVLDRTAAEIGLNVCVIIDVTFNEAQILKDADVEINQLFMWV